MRKIMLGAAGLLLAAAAGSTPVDGVNASMRVEPRAGRLLVHMTAENRGARTIYVPVAVFGEHELFGKHFEVRKSASGAPLDYIGPMVKRGPLGKDDYIAVKPHGKRRNTVDITRAYAFLPGTHRYRISYAGQAVADLAQLEQAGTLVPEPVEFSYAAK